MASIMAVMGLMGTMGSGCSTWRTKPQRCNPLGKGEGEDCFLPFPSSYYTRPDASSPTGVRVDLTDAALPVSTFGSTLDPAPYNRRDGFSTASTLLAYFPARLDGTGLPDPDHTDRSLETSSPVQLIAFDTGERVPVFAELDANADPRKGDKQALVIQPVTRLRPRTRYVAMIQGMRDTRGEALKPLEGFRRLRDRDIPANSTLAGDQEEFEEVFKMLEKKGIARGSLQLAWDFTTGSEEGVSGRLVRMRDQALGEQKRSIASEVSPVRVAVSEENPAKYPEIWKRVIGTYQVPDFLQEDGNRLNTDPMTGEPVLSRIGNFPIAIQVPQCAKDAKGPLPVMIYGHGTFNSAEHEMSNDYSRGLINKLCMIQVGTDWLGRSKSDLMYFLFHIIPNWNNFPQITDRLQQAHVNVAALARLVKSGALGKLAQLQRDGKSLVDADRIYYYGISEGGCQGVTALALSPDINRGALNVPCGFWSMFFWRSSDFHDWRHALAVTYPGTLERQKLMAVSQLLWDYTDPANYGSHLLHDPLAGNTVKRVLYQEGINDASVPNVTTRAMARTIGLTQLGPGVEPVEGIPRAAGPIPSAYVQFDVGSRPRLGANNIPPGKSTVHEDIRRLPAAQEQLAKFLREDGSVF